MTLGLRLDDSKRRQRHLIGVSGGRDSVVLLHELHRLGWSKLVVCHVDHQLRGRASTGDATFVRQLAERLGYAFELKRVKVAALAREAKISVETCARQVRHEFFAEMARKHRCTRVMLAHHAEDQAETVLMRVFRGTGIGGLAGMQVEAELRVGNKTLTLMRPMLTVRRGEIDDYVREHRVKFREDATNALGEATRNRVRLSVLPMISEAAGRDVVPMLLRLATVAEREDSFLTDTTLALIQNGGLVDDAGCLCLKPALRTAHRALQHRVMHLWLQGNGVADLSAELVEQVVRLMTEKEPAKINLPGGRWVRRKAGVIWVEG